MIDSISLKTSIEEIGEFHISVYKDSTLRNEIAKTYTGVTVNITASNETKINTWLDLENKIVSARGPLHIYLTRNNEWKAN